jgi:hypothetical protein
MTRLVVEAESGTGYERSYFKHGDRRERLLPAHPY